MFEGGPPCCFKQSLLYAFDKLWQSIDVVLKKA